MATLQQQIDALAQSALAAHGLVLVQAQLTGGTTQGRGKQTLNVLAERPDGTSPTLEECTQASRTLSAQLDVEDILQSAYTLEVGSAGLERPLLSVADYLRFAGRNARFTFTRPIENPTGKGGVLGTTQAVIVTAAEDSVTVRMPNVEEPQTWPLASIRHANLSPTEEEFKALIKEATRKSVEQKESHNGA